MTGHQIKVADSKRTGGGTSPCSLELNYGAQYRADDKILHRFRKSLDKLTTEKLISITIS